MPAAPSAREALETAGKLKGKVAEVSIAKFFAELAESADAAQFAKLKAAVTATLSDSKVVRVGKTTVNFYIAGKTATGSVAGLHTTSVKT